LYVLQDKLFAAKCTIYDFLRNIAEKPIPQLGQKGAKSYLNFNMMTRLFIIMEINEFEFTEAGLKYMNPKIWTRYSKTIASYMASQ
jgi:hypothetical protein